MNKKEVVMYIDYCEYEDDSIQIKLKQNSFFGTYSMNLPVTFSILNKTYQTKNFVVSGVTLTKEKTGAKYTVTYESSLKIEAEMTGTVSFSANIPSSLKEDNYKLVFGIGSYKVILYLYEKPDYLRPIRTVKYYVDNMYVNEDKVRDRMHSNYVYESSDHLYFCDTWYKNDRITKYGSDEKIEENITLYGNKKFNFDYYTSSSGITISSIVHVPSDGVLVIPKVLSGENIVSISGFLISNRSYKAIYVPNTITSLPYGSFKNMGNTKIYFEGTEEQWIKLFSSSNSVVLINVEFNKKYE